MTRTFGIFGEGWPVVLTVLAEGRRAPVAKVLAHPLDPSDLFWSTSVPRAPDDDDPRPFAPVLGRMANDPRWAGSAWFPANDLQVDRLAVDGAIRQRRKKLIVKA